MNRSCPHGLPGGLPQDCKFQLLLWAGANGQDARQRDTLAFRANNFGVVVHAGFRDLKTFVLGQKCKRRHRTCNDGQSLHPGFC